MIASLQLKTNYKLLKILDNSTLTAGESPGFYSQ